QKAKINVLRSTMDNGTKIACPQWLRREERADFERVISIREDAGRPISAGEVDLTIDYVLTRSRIRSLQRALGRRGDDSSVQIYRDMAQAIRQSRQLGRDLGPEFSPQSR